jgi:hypothetical protein
VPNVASSEASRVYLPDGRETWEVNINNQCVHREIVNPADLVAFTAARQRFTVVQDNLALLGEAGYG